MCDTFHYCCWQPLFKKKNSKICFWGIFAFNWQLSGEADSKQGGRERGMTCNKSPQLQLCGMPCNHSATRTLQTVTFLKINVTDDLIVFGIIFYLFFSFFRTSSTRTSPHFGACNLLLDALLCLFMVPRILQSGILDEYRHWVRQGASCSW